MMRFELMTSSLPRKRSTPELHRRKVFYLLLIKKRKRFLPSQEFIRAGDQVHFDYAQYKLLTNPLISFNTIAKINSAYLNELRAGDQVRTGDIQLGRLTLYQLSYSRFYYFSKFQCVFKTKFASKTSAKIMINTRLTKPLTFI